MTKAIFNIGERRGMLIIIGILSIFVFITFFINNRNNNQSEDPHVDSVARELRMQVKNSKPILQKETPRKKKKAIKAQNKRKFIERNPLNEPLPSKNINSNDNTKQ